MENGIDEILTEHNAQTVVEETKTEEDLSDKTVAEVVYDHNKEEKKSEIQKEIEKEAAENTAIPDPVIKEPEVAEVEETEVEKQEDVETKEETEESIKEGEVSEVVDELMKEDDKEIQKKQWEELLMTLRDEVLNLKREKKEAEIEIVAQDKKIQELIEEVKNLKYSGAVKLDDEMSYELHLRDRVKKDPKDIIALKQLSTYHMKQISSIYPEFDIKESFDVIETKRKNGILALSSGSDSVVKQKREEQRDPFKEALKKGAFAPKK